MRLKEITGVTPLLSKDGTLLIEGWAKHPYFTVPSRRPSHTMWKGSCLIFSRQNGYIITISICLQAISCTAAVSFTDLKRKQSVSIKAKQHSSTTEGNLSDSALSDYFITFQDKARTLTMTFIHRGKSCFIIFNAPSLVLPDLVISSSPMMTALPVSTQQPQQMMTERPSLSAGKSLLSFFLTE